MKAILALVKLTQLTLYGKVTLAAKLSFRVYKLYLKLKFNKMSDIQKIKEILKPTIKLTVELIKDLKDGKLSKKEAFGLIPEAFQFIKEIPSFKEALAELKNFDLDDAKELVEYVKGLEDLDDTKAKVIITHVVELYKKSIIAYDEDIKVMIDVLK